eukprot:TRINITY_DN2239_c0_g1_i2.p1 TRINITY_DN2239_c0_g1~~TRINITY_DN2239_c0_g1_i2.p1  ORF type:complete len:211 (+),score=46.08 TRINITY_DN2239_c0_g1_i2:222-854(+)
MQPNTAEELPLQPAPAEPTPSENQPTAAVPTEEHQEQKVPASTTQSEQLPAAAEIPAPSMSAALVPPATTTAIPAVAPVPSVGEVDYRAAGADGEEPDPKRAKTAGDVTENKTRARSGRPNGVKCVCRCCGAHGFYQRSCGKKHQCLLGKCGTGAGGAWPGGPDMHAGDANNGAVMYLSLIHISEPTRLLSISYAVFCLKKKKKKQISIH